MKKDIISILWVLIIMFVFVLGMNCCNETYSPAEFATEVNTIESQKDCPQTTIETIDRGFLRGDFIRYCGKVKKIRFSGSTFIEFCDGTIIRFRCGGPRYWKLGEIYEVILQYRPLGPEYKGGRLIRRRNERN